MFFLCKFKLVADICYEVRHRTDAIQIIIVIHHLKSILQTIYENNIFSDYIKEIIPNVIHIQPPLFGGG